MTTDLFSTLGGRVTCIQCNALSKRSKTRCRAPAIKGKTKCRFHGGRSTGPRTAEGRARIASANTLHGRDTRAKRAEYGAGMVNHVLPPPSGVEAPKIETISTDVCAAHNKMFQSCSSKPYF